MTFSSWTSCAAVVDWGVAAWVWLAENSAVTSKPRNNTLRLLICSFDCNRDEDIKQKPPRFWRDGCAKQKDAYFTILLSDLPAVNPGVLVAGILISAPV